jgi:Flp pilus assembly protein TadG
MVMSKRQDVRGPIAELPRCVALKEVHRWLSAENGNTIIELALTLPILLLVMTAIWQFGIVYNQMISLTQAATQGAQYLQTASTSADPCAGTFSAITGFAPSLSSTKIVVTITAGTTKITTNTCPGQKLSSGETVSVQASYPYTVSIAGMSIATGNMNTGTISETMY